MTQLPREFPIAAAPAELPELTPAQTALAELLYKRTGQKLTATRIWRIEAMVSPILAEQEISTIESLVEKVTGGVHPALERKVLEALLNNESYFFRDSKVFDMLGQTVLPHIADTKTDRKLRIWCAGCSTGQEVYSLAMTLAEQPLRWSGWDIEILGTDFSDKALQRAIEGIYSQFEIQRGVSMVRLVKFFDKMGDSWRIKDKLRGNVRFVQDNLVTGRDIGRDFDLVLCRNVLIYFSPEGREIAYNRFARALQPGGHLVLGAGETIMGEEYAFRVSPHFGAFYERTDDKVPPARSLRTGI